MCLCVGVDGDLVVGDRAMSAPVRDARLQALNTDLRTLGAVWRDLGMCAYRQAVLKKQVKGDRQKEREGEKRHLYRT